MFLPAFPFGDAGFFVFLRFLRLLAAIAFDLALVPVSRFSYHKDHSAAEPQPKFLLRKQDSDG